MMEVKVNRVPVPEEDVRAEAAHVESGTIGEKHAEAARTLAIRELLRQRAEMLGIHTGDRLDGAIDELLERELGVPEADEKACRRYFEANPERFRTPREVELRHILLAAAPDDAERRVAQRDEAERIIDTLQSEPDRFGELAGRHSDCPSSDQGGHLGIVGRGQTVPEFEQVVLRLLAGLAERPIETRYGFHVVELLSRAGGEPLAYEDVREMIADYLQERSWRRAVSQYIGQLAASAELEGVEIEVPDSPLVQ